MAKEKKSERIKNIDIQEEEAIAASIEKFRKQAEEEGITEEEIKSSTEGPKTIEKEPSATSPDPKKEDAEKPFTLKYSPTPTFEDENIIKTPELTPDKEKEAQFSEVMQQVALLLERRQKRREQIEQLRQTIVQEEREGAAGADTSGPKLENTDTTETDKKDEIEGDIVSRRKQEILREEDQTQDELDTLSMWPWNWRKILKKGRVEKQLMEEYEELENLWQPPIGATPEEKIGAYREIIHKLYGQLDVPSFFGPNKKEEGRLTRLISIRERQIEEIEKEEIEKDRAARPFLYYAAEKITDPNFRYTLEGSTTDLIDLRWEKEGDGYGQVPSLQRTGDDEGFFRFNTLGFLQIIKNVKHLSGEDGINDGSEEAIYKITGPDGTIIADDIRGYDTAREIYTKAIEDYRLRVEQEFNNQQ